LERRAQELSARKLQGPERLAGASSSETDGSRTHPYPPALQRGLK
jgi:hypothetical protein